MLQRTVGLDPKATEEVCPPTTRCTSQAWAGLTTATLPVAVEIACPADLVRGYEEIKLANVEHFCECSADLEAG